MRRTCVHRSSKAWICFLTTSANTTSIAAEAMGFVTAHNTPSVSYTVDIRLLRYTAKVLACTHLRSAR